MKLDWLSSEEQMYLAPTSRVPGLYIHATVCSFQSAESLTQDHVFTWLFDWGVTSAPTEILHVHDIWTQDHLPHWF